MNEAATGVIGDCLLHLADENWMSGAEDHSGRGVTSVSICRTYIPQSCNASCQFCQEIAQRMFP
jgi:hypothetical protein